jgi:hypothetical protein
MMIAVAVLGVASWAVARYERKWTYYASGWWEAERELWRGRATIYSGGGLALGDIVFGTVCNIDRDTGLPFARVFGCVIEEGDFERVRGHNDHIAQYIRWHGLPRNTLKQWEEDLFDLKRWFAVQSRAVAPKRVLAGGPALVSTDARNSVRPLAGAKDDGSQDESLKIVITAGNVVLADRYVRFGFEKGDSDLLWGPKGAQFAVIRSIFGDQEKYEAYDLRTGRHLRGERWCDGKPCPPGSTPVSLHFPRKSDVPPAPPDANSRARE